MRSLKGYRRTESSLITQIAKLLAMFGTTKRTEWLVKIYRGVEQLVARRAHNPKVTGSSPVPATQYRVLIIEKW